MVSFKCTLTTTYSCPERVVILNCVDWVGLWPCMWGLSNDVGGLSPSWMTQQSSHCCDSPDTMDWNIGLWAKINAFLYVVFYKNISSQWQQWNWASAQRKRTQISKISPVTATRHMTTYLSSSQMRCKHTWDRQFTYICSHFYRLYDVKNWRKCSDTDRSDPPGKAESLCCTWTTFKHGSSSFEPMLLLHFGPPAQPIPHLTQRFISYTVLFWKFNVCCLCVNFKFIEEIFINCGSWRGTWRIGSILSLCRSPRSNLGCQPWCQLTLPPDPSHQPSTYI